VQSDTRLIKKYDIWTKYLADISCILYIIITVLLWYHKLLLIYYINYNNNYNYNFNNSNYYYLYTAMKYNIIVIIIV